MNTRVPAILLPAVLLAACASAPQTATSIAPGFDPVGAVTAIRAAGRPSGPELVVTPVADPGVADLREDARTLEQQGRYEEAAEALDAALALRPDDAGLLQERAEAALLLGDLETAEQLARRLTVSGTGAGPQCRRHWETLAQVMEATRPPVVDPLAGTAATPAEAVDARARRDACTVSAPVRY
ncbi:MAG: tetratricopeptide repeat protein [Lysobacter spongiicola]|nr:tetratricopeptide repeat protein [Lysobacter spongiicola]